MVKKLKGKATRFLHGKEKREREKEFNAAYDFIRKILPLILIIILGLIYYFHKKLFY